MPLYARYIMAMLAGALAAVTAILTAAIWLTQSLRFLEMTVAGGAPAMMFLRLVALAVPSLLVVVLPVACFICLLFIYNRLATDHELVILRATGRSSWTLALPGLLVASFVAVAGFGLQGWTAPSANAEMKRLRQIVRTDYSGILLREGVFNPVDDHLTVYIRERTADGELRGLILHEDRPGSEPITIVAERGQLVESEAGLRVLVSDGRRQSFERETGNLSTLEFSRYAFDLDILDEEIAPRWREPSERTLPELLDPPRTEDDRRHAQAMVAEFHARLATPWLAVALGLVAMACLLCGPIDRRGQGKRILIAVGLALLIQGASLGGVNLARRVPEAIILIYLASILPAVLAIIALMRDRVGTAPSPKLAALPEGRA